MTTNDLEQYRAGLLAEQQAELDAVKAKFKRKLDALGVLLEESPRQRIALPQRTLPPPRRMPTPSVLFAVREAIEQQAERFSTPSVFAYIRQKYPGLAEKPSDLSNAMWVLKTQSKEIEMIESGVGQKPAAYKVTDKFRRAHLASAT